MRPTPQAARELIENLERFPDGEYKKEFHDMMTSVTSNLPVYQHRRLSDAPWIIQKITNYRREIHRLQLRLNAAVEQRDEDEIQKLTDELAYKTEINNEKIAREQARLDAYDNLIQDACETYSILLVYQHRRKG